MANKNKFGCNRIGNQKNSITNPMMIEIQSLILWRLNIFGHHSYGDWKLLITNHVITKSPQYPIATKSIFSPILWWLNFFKIVTCMATKSFHFRFQLSIWWWINLHHWFGDEIWCCLVIKSKEVVISIHFLLRGVCALCYLTSNHCHIPWEGGVKPLWVFKF